MSMANEDPNEDQGSEYGAGYGPEYGAPDYAGDPGTDPVGQFDAFRARQADEFAQQQQETQTSYTFPPEYAASPEPAPPYAPPLPVAAPPGGAGRGRRTRSALIFGGAVLVACVLGLGAWLAFGSSSSSADTASTGAAPVAGASATGTAKATDKRALTFRVTIVSVASASFTGTVAANGESVTVTLDSKTRYGTKEHAFAQNDLTVGETVIVRGRRTGTDAITATEVAANVAKSTSTAKAPSNTTATGNAA